MTKNNSQTSKIKRPKAAYHEKSNVSEKADYLEGSWTKMKNNSLFISLVAYLTTALGYIATFRAAIQAAISGGGNTIAARDAAELNVDIAKDKILASIQEAADADLANAVTIIEGTDAYVITRKTSERELLEVEHGVLPGTFDLYCKPLACRFAVLFMISSDNIHWDVADFSHNSTGFIGGCTIGQKYYFKAQTSSAEGKSAWTYVLDVYAE